MVKIRLKLPVTFYKDFGTKRLSVTFPTGWEFDNVNKHQGSFMVSGVGGTDILAPVNFYEAEEI